MSARTTTSVEKQLAGRGCDGHPMDPADGTAEGRSGSAPAAARFDEFLADLEKTTGRPSVLGRG